MANPQKEDGYTALANEIIDEFCRLNLNAYEWRVLMAVIRKTYGWHKKQDFISMSQFEKITGLDRRHIGRARKSLVRRGIITIASLGNRTAVKTVALQKDYSKWKLLPIQATLLPIQATVLLPIQATTKDIFKDKRIYIAVLSYLNKKTGKNFKETMAKNKRLINSRLKEGFSVDDFKKVIDIKSKQWLQDPKMCAYLRPETLFGTKFESYLNEWWPGMIKKGACKLCGGFGFYIKGGKYIDCECKKLPKKE